MKTMEDLRRRIGNVKDVQSIVSTMKTMAAAQVRQYESAADAMAEYLRTVELAFHVLQRNESAPGGYRTRLSDGFHSAIVFGSDQGLCGKFNEVIVHHAVSRISDGTLTKLIVVGTRAAGLLESALQPLAAASCEHSMRGPVTVSNITRVMQELMPIVSHWQLGGASQIDIHFNSRTSASSFSPETFRLFPILPAFLDRCKHRKWESPRLPIYTMDRQALYTAVLRQYLFVGLYRACAESRASENASRIAAMQAASKNIDRRLHELKTEFNESRQSAITEEILEISAGAEALK